ncbi:MAG: hypothetical protein JSV86_12870 [Gemmatimonadota bacterium]|nr:MAG: hypothetical protein JSV86_12870 [Gemmatimonadota bacterium]
MRRPTPVILAACVAALFLAGLAAAIGEARPSCCSDRDVLLKGMWAAHDELVLDEPENARRIIEYAIRSVGEEIPE